MKGEKLLLVLFLLSLPLVTFKLRGADEIEYFAYLPSLVFDQDLDFGNEYRHFVERDPQGLAGFQSTFLERREPVTGRPINFAPIGSAVLWAPFYLLAHAGVLLARAGGSSLVADGLSTPYVAAACLASASYGLFGLILVHRLLRRHFGLDDGIATAAVLALWLGSPLLYYMTVAPGFSHASSVFAVGLMLSLWLAETTRADAELRLPSWAGIGLAGGLCGIVREQDGFLLLLPGLWMLKDAAARRDLRRALARGLALVAGTVLAVLPQLFAYRALNGHFGPTTLVARKMDWTAPHLLDVLFDSAHGLFAWSPILLLAVLGLALRLVQKRETSVALLLLGAALQTWLNGSVLSWSMAGAFGSRRFLSLTPIFALGLAAALSALVSRAGRTAARSLVAVAVWWNVSLMVQFGLKLMDRQGLVWPEVMVNQVTAVPQRLARVAWLYLVDREALVKETR